MKPHKIADVKVHLVSMPAAGKFTDATRKVEMVGFVIVRVMTDQGLEGFGVTYHEVGGEATRELINRNMAHRIKGRDPFDTELIWQDFFQYLRGVGRKGLMYCALSAIDFALWDLKGKILNMPLYKLFGGGRKQVPVYSSGGWTSYTDEELVEEMLDMVKREGYTKIKFKVGFDGGHNINCDVIRVRKVREAVGEDIDLLLDANNCWDAATAVQFANRVREYNPLLLEEPVFADDIPGLARFKKGTDVPLATGEHEYTRFGVRDLLMHDAADYVQVDGARVGGFTEMLKCAALTQAWNVKFAPHAMEDMHIHLVSACLHAPFLERLRLFEPLTAATFKNARKPKDGYMELSDDPGLGLALDMDFIRDHDEKN